MNYEDEDERVPTGIAIEEADDGSATVKMRFEAPTRDDIADALARKLVAQYGVGEPLRKMVSDRVAALVAEAVNGVAMQCIGVALGEPRQPTDAFGNPTGPARTFAQMIGEQVAAWQDQTVDAYQGTPKTKDSYSNSNVITRAQYLVRQVGAAEFEKAAKEAVAKVRTDAKAALETTIKTAVASGLAALAK